MTMAAPAAESLTAEHEQLRAAVRRSLEAECPESAVRSTMETVEGVDQELWRRFAREFDVAGLMVPESLGGSGYTFVELSVVLEEVGRALLPAPLLSTCVLAPTALLASGDARAQKKYLPGLISGELLATAALPGSFTGSATRYGPDQWELTGAARFVLDGHTADVVLVAAPTAHGPTLFAVSANAPGVAREPLSTLDQTRKLAHVRLDRAAAEPLGEPGGADAVLAEVSRAAAVALACEQVGGAQKVLDLTVGYVRTRTQFGRAIGSFQAVKHRCVDMLVDVESARSVAMHATRLLAQDHAEAPQAAAMAKAFCSDAYLSCAEAAVQLHGGLGFTWEYSAHLHLKRAKSGQLLFGDPAHHRRVLGDLLGL